MKAEAIPEDDQRQGNSDDTAIQFGNELALRKAFDQVFELSIVESRDGRIDALLKRDGGGNVGSPEIADDQPCHGVAFPSPPLIGARGPT